MASCDKSKLQMFDIVFVDIPNENNEQTSEQNGKRPYIIIQNNIGNKYSPTVLGISLTTKIKKEHMPIHCIIKKTESNGLKQDSMALAETLRQIDKKRIISKIGTIEDRETQRNIIDIYIANITGVANNILNDGSLVC